MQYGLTVLQMTTELALFIYSSMKKLLILLSAVMVTMGLVNAQVSTNYWKLQAGILSPANSSWTVNTGGGSSATNTFAYVIATSSTATSTFAGNVEISGNLRVLGNFYAPVSIVSAGNITPSADVTYTLGTTALRWLAVHTFNASTTNLTVASTSHLGNIVPRTVNASASTSITIDTDTTDILTIIVAHATTTFNTPTGTLYNGKMFEIMLTSTTTRGLAWSTGFASSTDLAMPVTNASGTSRFIYEYRSQSAKWEIVGYLTGFTN